MEIEIGYHSWEYDARHIVRERRTESHRHWNLFPVVVLVVVLVTDNKGEENENQ